MWHWKFFVACMRLYADQLVSGCICQMFFLSVSKSLLKLIILKGFHAIKEKQGQLPQSRAGGQGPYLRSLDHLGRSSEARDCENPKKVKCEEQTNGQTDGPTKRGVQSRSSRLEMRDSDSPVYNQSRIFTSLIEFLSPSPMSLFPLN